ncbi:MAG: hypothetical protein JXB48_14845 [Candidatus Latescibacteria bacterium]|nr:hypothetical protein [Candidatus Latescibacterota bacterium]
MSQVKTGYMNESYTYQGHDSSTLAFIRFTESESPEPLSIILDGIKVCRICINNHCTVRVRYGTHTIHVVSESGKTGKMKMKLPVNRVKCYRLSLVSPDCVPSISVIHKEIFYVHCSSMTSLNADKVLTAKTILSDVDDYKRSAKEVKEVFEQLGYIKKEITARMSNMEELLKKLEYESDEINTNLLLTTTDSDGLTLSFQSIVNSSGKMIILGFLNEAYRKKELVELMERRLKSGMKK